MCNYRKFLNCLYHFSSFSIILTISFYLTGMQAAVIEYSRSMLGRPSANSRKFDPTCSDEDAAVVFMPEINPKQMGGEGVDIMVLCVGWYVLCCVSQYYSSIMVYTIAVVLVGNEKSTIPLEDFS